MAYGAKTKDTAPGEQSYPLNLSLTLIQLSKKLCGAETRDFKCHKGLQSHKGSAATQLN